MSQNNPSAKPRLAELEIVRAICILAVVVIHGTSSPIGELAQGSMRWSGYFALNKALHFTVPVFLFLSGLVLAYRYHDKWSLKQAPGFYLKRIKQVLVPYLIWSLFYYISVQLYTDPTRFTVDIPEFLDMLWWADTGYHLYFLIIVMQFYVLFPFYMSLVNMLRLRGVGLFLFGLAVHAAYYYVEFNIHSFGHRASICLNYFTLLTFGMAAGIGYARFRENVKRYVWPISGLAVLFGGAFVGMYLANAWYGSRFDNSLFEAALNGYAASMAAACTGWASLWSDRIRQGWIYSWLAKAGAASFGIYLLHPAWLTYWRMEISLPNWPGMYTFYQVGGIAWCFFGAWLTYALHRMWKNRKALVQGWTRGGTATGQNRGTVNM